MPPQLKPSCTLTERRKYTGRYILVVVSPAADEVGTELVVVDTVVVETANTTRNKQKKIEEKSAMMADDSVVSIEVTTTSISCLKFIYITLQTTLADALTFYSYCMLFYSLYVQLLSFTFTVICAVYFCCIFFSFTVLCVDCVFYCLLPSGVLNK